MNKPLILSVFSIIFSKAFAFAADTISDKHRVDFYNLTIPNPICLISAELKISMVKAQEKCLVLDNDPNSKKIIVKMKCNPDEVRAAIMKSTNEYCKDKRLSGQPSQSNASSTDPSKAANPVKPPNPVTPVNPTQTAKPASTPSAGSGQPVIGGCGSPEQCAAYMAEAAKPKYGWQSPTPFMNGPIDKLNHMRTADGQSYELPANACGPNNQGELLAINYGTEVVVAACMGDKNLSSEEIMKKIKAADISKLPQVVAVKKELYTWQCLSKAAPLAEGQMRICDGTPRPCEKVILGQTFSGGPGCETVKCVRIDGGGLATDKSKPKPKSPCDE